MTAFAQRLVAERKRLGLTQSELAAIGGVQRGAQVSYESAKRSPDSDYLIKICAARADAAYLITGVRSGAPKSEVVRTLSAALVALGCALPALLADRTDSEGQA